MTTATNTPTTIIDKLDQCLQTIHDTNCALYKENVKLMDNERLAQEFSDRIGNELGDFEWYMCHNGREAVEEQLCGWYESVSFEKLLGGH